MKRKTLYEILYWVYLAFAWPTFLIIPTMAIVHDVGNWGLALLVWLPSLPSPFMVFYFYYDILAKIREEESTDLPKPIFLEAGNIPCGFCGQEIYWNWPFQPHESPIITASPPPLVCYNLDGTNHECRP